MIKIGIDFSVISTGMCVFDGEYKFYWFPRMKNGKSCVSNKMYESLPKCIGIIPYVEISDDGEYTNTQLAQILNANELVGNIIRIINGYKNKEEVEVHIEGFSYNSGGNSIFDLCIFQSILRYKLLIENKILFHIHSPGELKKKFSGKGNADKNMMIESFLNIKSDDNTIIEIQNCLDNTKKNVKPFDDLIDAFALVTC